MEYENDKTANSPLIVQVGTHVVTLTELVEPGADGIKQRGSVGKIAEAPHGSTSMYRIAFSDGSEVSANRQDFGIRKVLQGLLFEDQPGESTEQKLFERIIYRCTIGSRAYGLDVEGSDYDTRGIFLPPADLHWSLNKVPEQIENKDNEECYWEIEKFLLLALKANPNALECLYTPLVVHSADLANELLENRHRLLSQLVYQTYNGYVMSQFRKLEQDMRTRGELKWKHAMHLVRLLLSGITILREGYVPVKVTEHREKLLAIRRGERDWKQIDKWRLELHKEFDRAAASTSLPERPDYKWADSFLISARLSAVQKTNS